MTATPGPWTYEYEEELGLAPHVVLAGDLYIASVHETASADETQTLDNARLIAAAPDLLEFARAVAEWHHDGLCPAGPIDDGQCECFVGFAAAAVARATGTGVTA